jgi:serine/threonine protein kinase
MDLKPSNILVVIDDLTREKQWKPSDFNMSRVKAKSKYPGFDQPILHQGRTFDHIYDFNTLFKRRIPDRTDSYLTDSAVNRRGTGTYLAPETSTGKQPIRAESDTWSLGCIVSVVFSYLYSGNTAVIEFGDLRSKKAE